VRGAEEPQVPAGAPRGEEHPQGHPRPQGLELDAGVSAAEESAGVEGDQTRLRRVGAQPGAGIGRSCGALTPIALRAPSVSGPQELLTLLRRGTSYFALTLSVGSAAYRTGLCSSGQGLRMCKKSPRHVILGPPCLSAGEGFLRLPFGFNGQDELQRFFAQNGSFRIFSHLLVPGTLNRSEALPPRGNNNV